MRWEEEIGWDWIRQDKTDGDERQPDFICAILDGS